MTGCGDMDVQSTTEGDAGCHPPTDHQSLAKEFAETLDTIAPDLVLSASLPKGVTVTQDNQGRIVVTQELWLVFCGEEQDHQG